MFHDAVGGYFKVTTFFFFFNQIPESHCDVKVQISFKNVGVLVWASFSQIWC